MAEPARNLYDEDKPENKNDPSPRFEVHKGGGETTTPKKGHLKSVDDSGQSSKSEKDLYNEGDKKLSASKAEELEARQLGVKPENKDSLYNIKAEAPTNFIKKNKKTAAFMAVAATMVVGISIFFFVILAPLKILHIVNNLQDRFFATAENAVDKEMDRLFSNYIKGKVRYWNRGQNCTGNGWIDHACNPYSTGDGLVRKLYRGWSDGKLEDKLKKDYGIQFARRDGDSRLFMEITTPQGLSFVGVDDADFLAPDSTVTIDDKLRSNPTWSPAKRQEIRLAVKQALQHETRYKQVMYRIKVGKLLERKYGIKRCIIGCKYRDNFADWRDDKKRALKMNAAQRVLAPRAETFSYLYQCVMSNTCTPDTFKNFTPDTYQATAGGCQTNCIDGGEPKSEFDRTNRNMLARRLVQLYDGDVDKLRADYDRVARLGIFANIGRFSSRVDDDGTTRGNGNLRRADLARTVALRGGSRAIPVIGQIDMAFTIVNSVDTLTAAGPAMINIMNSTSASQYFAMYRTSADEMKEGQLDNTMFGSFVEGLGPGIQVDSTAEKQEPFGGTAGAEQSPLYGVLMGTEEERANFAFGGNIFGQSVMAQSASAVYECDNGSTPTNQNPVCPEQAVRQVGNAVLGTLQEIMSSSSWQVLSRAAELWTQGRNTLFDIIGGIFSGAFGFALCGLADLFLDCDERLGRAADRILGGLVGWLNDQLRDAIMYIFTNIFGLGINIITNDMSGAWAFNAMSAGADVAGNSYAHSGLGGRKLSAQEVAQIINEQESEKYLAYQSQSLLERLFDSESKYSPVSKLALTAPTSKKELLAEGPVAYVSSLFGSLFGSASNLFDGSAKAQRVMDDPFGIDQYGYPENDSTLAEDPETFWNRNCVTTAEGATPDTWSLPRLYNQYASYTADLTNSYSPTNGVPSVAALSTEVRDDPVRLAEAIQVINALLLKSPQGTNRCLLIQAAVGSGGAVFTDDVLSPEEKSTTGVAPPNDNEGSEPPVNQEPGVQGSLALVRPPNFDENRRDSYGYYQMPPSLDGCYRFESFTPESERYGQRELIYTIYTVAQEMCRRYPGSVMNVGDLNAIEGHASHNVGEDVDLDVTGRNFVAADRLQSGYSASHTTVLGQLFMATGYIEYIFWCDDNACSGNSSDNTTRDINAFARREGVSGTAMDEENHANHFHVRLNLRDGPDIEP